MEFLKKKKNINDELTNEDNQSVEDNIENSPEQSNDNSSSSIEPEKLDISKEDIAKNVKAPNKKLTKPQILAIGGIAVAVGLYFNMGGTEETTNTNIDKNIVQTDLVFDERMDILEASKDKDFLSRLKFIEDQQKEIIELKKGKGTATDLIKLKAIKFGAYEELSKLLFTSQYKISNNEYLYRKKDSIYHHLFQGNEVELDNIAAVPLVNGAILRIENLDMDYIISTDNPIDTEFQKIKDINIWRIDPNVGLKKILTLETQKDILSYVHTKEKKDDVFIKKYVNKIILIGNNAEIKEELDFFSKKDNDIEMPKDVRVQYALNEYTLSDFTKLTLKNNSQYMGETKMFEKKGLYTLKYMKYNDPEEGLSERIFLLRNNKIIKAIPLSNARSVSLINYKNTNGEEYVNKEGILFKLNTQTNLLEEIGTGVIFGKISQGQLDNVALSIVESSEEKMPIDNLVGKIMIDDKRVEYKVTEDGVFYQSSIYPISAFSITGNGFLYYEDEKVAKIVEIKYANKTGASITTTKHKIDLFSKDRYEIYDNDSNLLYNQDTYNKIDFKISFENEKITAVATTKAILDENNKKLNEINYDKYELRNNIFYLFDEEGNLTHEIKKEEQKVLFENKIINFELIDGDVFDYYFQIDTLTGKIESNDIGKFIKKYNKSKIPFKQFLAKNKQKYTQRTIDSKLKNKNSFSSVVLLSDLLKDKNYPYITFSNKDKQQDVKILDEKTLIINGKDELQATKIYLNTIKNKFLISTTESLINRQVKKRYKININNNSINMFFKEIKLDDLNYIDKVSNTKLFKYNNVYFLKTNENKEYQEVLSIDIDLINNKLKIVDIQDNNFETSISSLEEMNDREYATYIKLIDLYLNPRENEEDKIARMKKQKAKQAQLEKSEEFKKQLAEFQNQNSQKVTITLNKKKVEEIKKKDEKPDFTFEIGTKMKFVIKESMEVVEGMPSFALGYISNLKLRDLSDNEIQIKNANVVLELEGDFSKQKIMVHPLKIIFKDSETDEKRVIDLDKDSTQFKYKEDGYETIGVPSYMINAKLKNINTTVILSTVSGILENLTKPEDTISSLVDSQAAVTGGAVEDDENKTLGEATASGINEGIQELITTMKEATDKEKNVLISDPNVKGESLFIKEIEVKFDDEESN